MTHELRVAVLGFECAPATETAEARDGWEGAGCEAGIVAELAEALAARGVDVSVTAPLHGAVKRDELEREGAPPIGVRFGRDLHRVATWRGAVGRGRVPIRFLENDVFFGASGEEAAASGAAAGFFARAALQALRLQSDRRPNVLHVHGAGAAAVPIALRLHHGEDPYFSRVKAAFTVHRGTMQAPGHDPALLAEIGLTPDRFYAMGPFEHEGRLSLVKAALMHADRITALSPGHAALVERTPMMRSLRDMTGGPVHSVVGIRVGIDVRSWDPSTDPRLPENFSAGRLQGKDRCRDAVLSEMQLPGLARGEGLLFAHVGPLTREAGADVALEAASEMASLGRVVIVGAGTAPLEQQARRLAAEMPDRVAVLVTPDRSAARRTLAGADCALLPGAGEITATRLLQALRYGAVPLVAPAPGFLDVALDHGQRGGNSFVLAAGSASALSAAARAAAVLSASRDSWTDLVEGALRTDASWDAPAEAYESLLHRIAGAH